jgi:hypothetical protein
MVFDLSPGMIVYAWLVFYGSEAALFAQSAHQRHEV